MNTEYQYQIVAEVATGSALSAMSIKEGLKSTIKMDVSK